MSRFVAVPLMAVYVLFAVGCGGSTPARVGSISMMDLPSRSASRCAATPLRPACPGVVPRVAYKLVAGGPVGIVVSGPLRVNRFWVFDLEHGAPDASAPRHNRPPGFLHVTIYTGDIPQANAGMAFPGGRRNATFRNGIVARKRPKPLLLGPVTWSGKKGALFLAPSYPVGGQIGGHLAFWWRAHGTNYLISIHAWEPLTECKKVLQAMVASTVSG
jgi:hypothetical protein